LLEWCRWAYYEPRMVRRYDHVLTFTEQDGTLLKRLSGIDHATYNPRGIIVPQAIVPYEQRESATLLFIGVFDHRPNIDAALWLCSEIFPRVRKAQPDVQLRIIGGNPPGALRMMTAKNSSIHLLGFVENLEGHYNSATLFVAPMLTGGGIKTKIIHAQSYGLPVVTTPLGAEGIAGASGTTLILGRTAEELADGICLLLHDRKKAAEVGMEGRKSAIDSYAWDKTVLQQEALYRSLLSQTPDAGTRRMEGKP